MDVLVANKRDIDSWMDLIRSVRTIFPGLETESEMEKHRKDVLDYMSREEALCCKDDDLVIGVILFSVDYNMICFLAVDENYRRRGIGSALLESALDRMNKDQDISVTTYRSNDENGTAARTLYLNHGFEEGDEVEEFGYPNQVLVRRANRSDNCNVSYTLCAEIRYANQSDKDFWFTLDKHMAEQEYEYKLSHNMAYVVCIDKKPVGIMRYGLFWDNIPFCNMLYIQDEYRGMCLGSKLMNNWEEDMRNLGYGMIMTSTQVNETAQHFYRKLGYEDSGALVLTVPGYEQPMEMFFVKKI